MILNKTFNTLKPTQKKIVGKFSKRPDSSGAESENCRTFHLDCCMNCDYIYMGDTAKCLQALVKHPPLLSTETPKRKKKKLKRVRIRELLMLIQSTLAINMGF
jgi:hypothetical protein